MYPITYLTFINKLLPLHSKSLWSEDGCVVVNDTAGSVTCHCDHATSFGKNRNFAPKLIVGFRHFLAGSCPTYDVTD